VSDDARSAVVPSREREAAVPVYVLPWHIRSVRAIRHEPEDAEDVTRIEFSNGQVLDVSEPLSSVLERMRDALGAVLNEIVEGVSLPS
jgi:hypothetical protein